MASDKQYRVARAVPANDPDHPSDWHVIDTRSSEVIAEKYQPFEEAWEDEEDCPYCLDGMPLVGFEPDNEFEYGKAIYDEDGTCGYCGGGRAAPISARAQAESLAAEINAAWPGCGACKSPTIEELWEKARELRITGCI
jgi:hypothetical protein